MPPIPGWWETLCPVPARRVLCPWARRDAEVAGAGQGTGTGQGWGAEGAAAARRAGGPCFSPDIPMANETVFGICIH